MYKILKESYKRLFEPTLISNPTEKMIPLKPNERATQIKSDPGDKEELDAYWKEVNKNK